MTTDPDKQLIDRCLRGEGQAWETFIRKFSPLVYYAIQKVLRGAGEAELADLHNDIFLSLMEHGGRKLSQYEGKNGCSISTWIRVIAIRAAIDYLKKRKDVVSLADEHDAGAAETVLTAVSEPLEHLTADEQRRILKELLEELPSRDRLFLRLLYYEEIPPADIARLLRITPNAVYSRGNYLREKLKEALRKKMCKDESP